jgi:hypothetical protein
MLKLLHKIEHKIAYKILRVVRGTLGHAQDATLNDIQILHDSHHFIVLNKRQDVLINHMDKDIPGKITQLAIFTQFVIEKSFNFIISQLQ